MICFMSFIFRRCSFIYNLIFCSLCEFLCPLCKSAERSDREHVHEFGPLQPSAESLSLVRLSSVSPFAPAARRNEAGSERLRTVRGDLHPDGEEEEEEQRTKMKDRKRNKKHIYILIINHLALTKPLSHVYS